VIRTAMFAGITRIRRKSTAARFSLVAGGTRRLVPESIASCVAKDGKWSVRRKVYASSLSIIRKRIVTIVRTKPGTRPMTSAANHPSTTQTKVAIPTKRTTSVRGMAKMNRSSTVHRRCFNRSGSIVRIGRGSTGGVSSG
jgi:hypothetical protein